MNKIEDFGLAWLSLTYNCNNNCIWCYAESNNLVNRHKSLDIKRLNPIILLLKDLGIKKVALIGGEPTLYDKIFDVIHKLSENGFSTHIVTNGRRFSNLNFAKKMKEKGLTHAGFSIEGSSSLLHNKITNVENSFIETVKGLENAIKVGIKTYSNTTICQSNINDLVNIVDFVSQYEIRSINFNICGPCLSVEHNYAMKPSQASNAYINVYNKLKLLGIKGKLLTATPLCNFEQPLRNELKQNRVIHGGPCQLAHGKNFVIDYNGDIIPCTHLTGFPMFNIFYENDRVISKDEFIDFYNDPKYIPFQFRKGMSRYASEKCERINCAENCAGGCPLFWTKFNPDKEITGIKN